MRAAVALALLLVACRDDGSTPAETLAIATYAGEAPAPGIRVISHRPNGEVIDDVTTDYSGNVDIGIEDGALLTALYPGTLVTQSAAPEIHGPPVEAKNDLVIGTVDVAAPAMSAATRYEVDLGCVTIPTTTFPRTFNVTTCSLGTDQNLDVLVRAFAGDAFLGYDVANVPLVDEHAVVNVAWKTTGTDLWVDGTVPAGADLGIRFIVDGNAYDAPPVVDGKYIGYWPAEPQRSELHAKIDTRTLDQVPMLKGYFIFNLDQHPLLPPVATTLSRTANTFTWQAPPFDVDTVELVARTNTLTWTATLPPTATSTSLPASVSLDETNDVDLAFVRGNIVDGRAATHEYGYP